MPITLFSAPFTPLIQLADHLRARGYAVLEPDAVAAWAGCTLQKLDSLRPSWRDLPPDEYLRDGGRYRRRRHACFVVEQGEVRSVAHRAHWQPVEYNALHGGMQRWFAPVSDDTVASSAWSALLQALARTGSLVRPDRPPGDPWYAEAHQFRIDTTDGIGRPTPEGAHRDGVDLVAVFLVEREGVKGGETRVFDAEGPAGQRFTLTQPWSLLLIDDARVIHESTPIQPLQPGGHRDTLVLTLRSGAFQGEDVAAAP